jgi:S-formylglutathione hydrolase FrmB
MTIYYLVYMTMSTGLPVLIGIHTDESKAYDILNGLKGIADENKWVQRIKTDDQGNVC